MLLTSKIPFPHCVIPFPSISFSSSYCFSGYCRPACSLRDVDYVIFHFHISVKSRAWFAPYGLPAGLLNQFPSLLLPHFLVPSMPLNPERYIEIPGTVVFTVNAWVHNANKHSWVIVVPFLQVLTHQHFQPSCSSSINSILQVIAAGVLQVWLSQLKWVVCVWKRKCVFPSAHFNAHRCFANYKCFQTIWHQCWGRYFETVVYQATSTAAT